VIHLHDAAFTDGWCRLAAIAEAFRSVEESVELVDVSSRTEWTSWTCV